MSRLPPDPSVSPRPAQPARPCPGPEPAHPPPEPACLPPPPAPDPTRGQGAGLPAQPPPAAPPRGGRVLARREPPAPALTPAQRLLVLAAWRRSGLPAGDFAPLVGVSKHTLYAWKRKFDRDSLAGLEDGPRGGPAGSRLPEGTSRAILLMKEANPA